MPTTDAPRPGLSRSTLLVVAGVVALLVTVAVAGAAYTGASAADTSGFADPGPVVRWGLPPLRALHDLAWALTIGTLVVAGTIMPLDEAGHRVALALRVVAASAFAWAVTSVGLVLLGFASASGLALTDPAYGSSLTANLWGLDFLRMQVIAGVAAAVIASVAVLVRTRGAVVGLLAVGLLGMWPLPLASHSGGALGHETAVNAMGFHVLGVVVWLGGLLALVVLRPTLTGVLAVTLRRYSRLALWMFATVALSGLALSTTRLTFSSLTTPYGVLVLAKVVLLLGLGVLGAAQRRHIVDRVEAAEVARAGRGVRAATDAHAESVTGTGRLFARLAGVELVLMALATGIATALARSNPPVPKIAINPTPVLAETSYPMPPEPTAASYLTAWRVDWLMLTLALLGLGLYVAGVVVLHRRGDRWPVRRLVAWVVGWLLFVWVTNGAFGIYGRVSFSWHMAGHMFEAMAIPILFVIGAPVTLALRALAPRRDGTWGPRELLVRFVHSRYVGFFANPIVAAVNFFFSLTIFYWSGLFPLALSTHSGHLLMIAHFVLTGYVFAWSLIGIDPGPPKWSGPLRLVILFATISFHAFFGIALMMGETVLAKDFFERIAVPWIPSLIEDQHLGGGIAWGIGEVPSLALAVLVALDWVRRDEHERVRSDRRADRDGDAELAAYNARLAAIARQDERRG